MVDTTRRPPAARQSGRRAVAFRSLLLLLVLLAFALRVTGFDAVPGGIQHDEVTEVLHAQQVLNGEYHLYFYLDGFKGREPLMAYLEAPFVATLGVNLWGLRFLSVAAGMVTVALTTTLARRLYGRRIALLAAAAIAVAFWPLVMSRLALRAVLVPPIAALAAYFMVRLGDRDARPAIAVGAGLALALACYAYLAGWALVAGMLVFACCLLVARRPQQRMKPGTFLVCFSAMGLAILPLALLIARQPQGSERVSQLSPLLQRAIAGDVQPLASNILAVLGSFMVRGDQFGLYNVPNQPILPLPMRLLFIFGLLLCLRYWRQPTYLLLPTWLLAGLLPAALAVGGPNHLRSVVSIPPTYLLVALGASGVLSLAARMRGAARLAPGIAVAALLIWSAQAGIEDFFNHWPGDPDTRYFFRSSLAEAVREMPGSERNCISSPYFNDLSPWVAQWTAGSARAAGLCWFRGSAGLVLPAGTDTVRWYIPAAISPDPYLAVQEDAELNPELAGLLQAAASHTVPFPDGVPAYRVIETGDAQALRARILAKLGSEQRAWAPADTGRIRPLSMPVQLNGGLAFVGAQYLPPQPGSHAVEVLLYWQVVQGPRPPAPLSVFLQLLDGDGHYVAGDDHLDYAPTSWRPGDVFVQLHRIEAPADRQPGVYYLSTGVYNWRDNSRWQVMDRNQAIGDHLLLPPIAVP